MREIKFRTWTGKKMHYGNSSIADKTDWPLMQFTGLKDREGKEIWEGDIITWGGINSIVQFGTILTDDGEKKATGWVASEERVSMYDDCFVDNTCEVLGNIYENPELLK